MYILYSLFRIVPQKMVVSVGIAEVLPATNDMTSSTM